MTVHDDLLASLAGFRSGPSPSPSPELRALFASVPELAAAPPAPVAVRKAPMYKRLLAGVPSKVAAGALGALLAGSLGAGALTGTAVLTSDEGEPAPAVCAPTDDADADAVDCGADGPAADDPAADDDAESAEVGEHTVPAVPADLSTVAVPATPSEAARTHAFDEACANHGAYVSDVAQTGEEPDCATAARAGTSTDAAPEVTHGTDKPAGDERNEEAGANSKRNESGKDGR